MKAISYNRNKIQLRNELISEFRMKELESFAYQKQDDEELPTMEEIQAEVNAVRRELLENLNCIG